MKVVIAIDSFKGSMSSMEAGNAAKEGVLRAMPQAEVVVKPLADGGEGTTDALIEGMGGERVDIRVKGPYGEPVDAHYGYIREKGLAVMEMAQASGITISERKDPMAATTYGVGEMILHALDLGCRSFIIGIGGSATNDGGVGMLKALGCGFLDKEGNDCGEGGAALSRISSIDIDGLDKRIAEADIRVACDVENPLCGTNGATYIYGPQKGVTEDMKKPLDEAMSNYADVCAEKLGKDMRDVSGAGAAGGLGFAFISFLGSKLVPGIELIMEATGLETEMKDGEIAITGEGRLDLQTAMGKAPVGVAKLAKKYGLMTMAFAGSVTKEAVKCNEAGIDAFFPIVRGISTLSEAMDNANARANMADTVEQAARLIAAAID
ncbi:MAG TPA: glycerate kinase [Candidatus Avilachnospira avicola]|nr:glycerate kinase [Candidatus Avilachnospira avicola]